MDKNSQRYSEKRFGAYLCQDFGGGQKKSPTLDLSVWDLQMKLAILTLKKKTFEKFFQTH